jgi:hypothetical protein
LPIFSAAISTPLTAPAAIFLEASKGLVLLANSVSASVLAA